MRLLQDGESGLDDDANRNLKRWRIPDEPFTRPQPVTPRTLMSHTSGADDGFGFPGYDPTAPRPSVVQILDGASPSNVGMVMFARPP